jgi:pimeloyl-ACP methyl ester carboxylesterase
MTKFILDKGYQILYLDQRGTGLSTAITAETLSLVDDAYVDFGLGQEALALVKNCRQYTTNTMYHDAIRTKTGDVLEQLFALRDDAMD